MAAAIAPIVVDDRTALAQLGARTIAEAVGEAVGARGVCYLALAGGETPRGCYEVLGAPPYQEGVPWARVFVFWSDERLVPLDDPASNYGMAKTALLNRVAIPSNHVFSAPVDAPEPAAAADRYAEMLAVVPKAEWGWPRFDVILLGLGEDGHTASLFPGDPVVEEHRVPVRAVHGSKPPPNRITFTLPVLNAARSVLFLVQGAGKREVLARVLRRDPALPAARVQPIQGALRFIVDREAFPG